MTAGKYTHAQVREATLAYFNGDEMATDVWIEKYALRNGHDVSTAEYDELTPEDMQERLAREFARIEAKYPNPMSYEEILKLFKRPAHRKHGLGQIVPQGSPLSAIGNPYKIQSLSNCFVVDSPHDSYSGIMYTDEQEAQIMKRRGGVGFDISTIRPKGLPTSNAAGSTDGIGVFMERWAATCREVAQGGRRGALMLTISCAHPEIETFIHIKRDRVKVTGANVSIRFTDEFMRAVEADTDFTLRWPVDVPVEKAQITRVVRARDIWEQVIDAAWDSAEPGVLFWDTALTRTPAEAYASKGFKTTSTNPCVTWETKVAVADGREPIEIGKLAEEGLDVPVYAVNSKGKIVVKTMRHPRLTGHQVPVFKVTIEGGHTFKATGNHKMILRDGSYREVKDLVMGDQLWVGYRATGKFNEAIKGMKATQASEYHWVGDCNSQTRHWKSEHRMIWEFHHKQDVPNNFVIHHVDHDSRNNMIENLQLMSKEEHDRHHADYMRGQNNPIFKIKANSERFFQYKKTLSEALSGLKNPRAYDVSNEVIINAIRSLIKKIQRRPSLIEWQAFAKQLGLPPNLSAYRVKELGTLRDISIKIASELGISHVEVDPRVQRTLQKAQSQGYEADVITGHVYVSRTCEWCGEEFVEEYHLREGAFCSKSCAQFYSNQHLGKGAVRNESIRIHHAQKAQVTKKKILDLYTELRFNLGRNPLQNELVSLCRERDVSYRTGTKYGFKNWQDVKEHAEVHNHRVISVEAAGFEDVYNGTVDDEHTFCFVVGQEKIERFEKDVTLLLGSRQCGEILLSPLDSCRLLIVDPTHFVKESYSSTSYFDWPSFIDVALKAQRLMDDLIDLEIEAIDKILAKIESDPEPEHVKTRERDLWIKIKHVARQGRRTGLGQTAIGDTIAMMGYRYGSPESVKFVEELYRQLCTSAYDSSIRMAEERGPFEAYEHDLEKDHPFIKQVMEAAPHLVERYQKFGRRNIALLTTAPVGSISTMTQTTSGIEPVFKVSYTRRKKINDTSVKPDYIDDLGDKWSDYEVYHQGVNLWREVNPDVPIDQNPYVNSESNEIDWEASVDLQAAAQKWICHSISKTCNLPKNVSHDVVNNVYLRAWKMGCKGFTVYRDGSRSGVLVESGAAKFDLNTRLTGVPVEELNKTFAIAERHVSHIPAGFMQYISDAKAWLKKQSEGSQNAPKIVDGSATAVTTVIKRPKELACDIHRVNVKGESYLVFVGLYDDKPYEIFCGLADQVDVPKKVKRGVLIKNGRNAEGVTTYNLSVPIAGQAGLVYKDIVTLFDNPVYGAFSRTISLALRHKIPLSILVSQLRKDKNSDITSFSSVISRVLSKGYITDGTRVVAERCSNCGSTQIQYQSGCPTCMSCGNTKCG